jgi:hypothetical protein
MIEVRCCCQPQKLLGWLDIPLPASACRITLPIPMKPVFHDAYPATRALGELTLAIEQFAPEGRAPYLAAKAEGVSIETLRLVSRFREAPRVMGQSE